MRRVIAVIGAVLLGLTTACSAATKPAAAHAAARTSVPQLSRDQAEQVFSGFVPELDSMQLSYGPGQVASPAASTGTTVLFVMVQADRGAAWKAAIEMAHVQGSSLTPTLASITLDSRGYATALPGNDPLLEVNPSSLPALYARQQDSEPGPAAFAAGAGTTEFLAQDKTIEARSTGYGWRVTDVQRPSGLPVYALKAASGGAVVIFVTYDQFSWTALSTAARLPAAGAQAASQLYAPGPSYAAAAGVTAVRAGQRISVQSFCQCIAYVPAGGGGLMDLPIYSGGLLGVTKS